MNLNQVTVATTDVARAIGFYSTLGLRLIVESIPRYARFECPDGESTFSIHRADQVAAPQTYATARTLSLRYQHHLFDTLYHAVALHAPGATLVTADRRCYDRVRCEGQIDLLANWSPLREQASK